MLDCVSCAHLFLLSKLLNAFNKSSCCCFAVGVGVILKARTGPLALLGQSQASPSQDSKAARLSIPIISLCAAIEPNPTNPEP